MYCVHLLSALMFERLDFNAHPITQPQMQTGMPAERLRGMHRWRVELRLLTAEISWRLSRALDVKARDTGLEGRKANPDDEEASKSREPCQATEFIVI